MWIGANAIFISTITSVSYEYYQFMDFPVMGVCKHLDKRRVAKDYETYINCTWKK